MFIPDKYNTKILGSYTINATFRYYHLNIFVLSGASAKYPILLLFEKSK